MICIVKDMGLNLATLLLESLHGLHQRVIDELKIRQQHALTSASKYKVNNQQFFAEKTQALKEKEELQTQCQNLVIAIE